MTSMHKAAILATATAVPFTQADAQAARLLIMGRFNRRYLRDLLIARHVVRDNVRRAIAAGHYLQACEAAALAHRIGVQAVLIIRAGGRAVIDQWAH